MMQLLVMCDDISISQNAHQCHGNGDPSMSDDDIKDNLPLEGLLSKILRLQYQLHTLEGARKDIVFMKFCSSISLVQNLF